MYLSQLLIDVGDNPDRPRPGRLWLRNVYRVHQRLCMAFPSGERKDADPAFLKPYKPEDFAGTSVHGAARSDDAGFLFRIDRVAGGNPVILVQSANAPDWDYAFHNARHLLAAAPSVTPVDPCFAVGQRLRFRLKVNPTKRVINDSKWREKRVPVPPDELEAWLARHGEKAGFQVADLTRKECGYIHFSKTGKAGEGQRLRSALFEGVLTVVEEAAFAKALRTGIGSGKAFGFGLLSIAPA